MLFTGKWLSSVKSGFDNAVNVAFAHDDQLFAAILDGVAVGVAADDHGVANLDGNGANLAVVQRLARADGNDFTLVGLFFRGSRQQDATGGFFLFFFATDYDAVIQRTNFHCRLSPPIFDYTCPTA